MSPLSLPIVSLLESINAGDMDTMTYNFFFHFKKDKTSFKIIILFLNKS